MKVKSGSIIYQNEADLAVREEINKHLEIVGLFRKISSQYATRVDEIMRLKIFIFERKAESIMYLFSFSRLKHENKLKKLIESCRSQNDSLERGVKLLATLRDNYESEFMLDLDEERKSLINTMYVSYAEMCHDAMKEQVSLIKKYFIQVKNYENIDLVTKNIIATMESQILRFDNKIKNIQFELIDIWLKSNIIVTGDIDVDEKKEISEEEKIKNDLFEMKKSDV